MSPKQMWQFFREVCRARWDALGLVSRWPCFVSTDSAQIDKAVAFCHRHFPYGSFVRGPNRISVRSLEMLNKVHKHVIHDD